MLDAAGSAGRAAQPEDQRRGSGDDPARPAGEPSERASQRHRHHRDHDPTPPHDLELTARRRRIADAVPGFFPPAELAALVAAAERAPAGGGWLVELGAYCGRSTIALGSVAADRGLYLLSVDHHRGSIEQRPPFPWADPRVRDGDLGTIDSLGTLRDALRLAALEEVVVAWVGTNLALASWARPLAGLVLIDGGHDALNAHLDLELARSLLVPGGLLCIHDVYEDPRDGGQAPWRVLVAALHLGFQLVARHGSLAVLEAGR